MEPNKHTSKPATKKKVVKKEPHNDIAKAFTQDLFDPQVLEPQNNGQDQAHASAEIFKEIMKETFSKEDISLKTELNDRQIKAFASGTLFSRRYNLPIMEDLAIEIMEKSVSRNRKGRKEYSDIAKASFQSVYNQEQVQERGSIPDRLMGRSR